MLFEWAAEFQQRIWPTLSPHVDVLICSVPALFCRLYLGLGRPVLGYLALPPLHSVPRGEVQRRWYADFRALLSGSGNTFVCFNTYLATAIAWQFGGPRPPVVRLFGWHAHASHIPRRPSEVLVARDGKAHALQECLLARFTRAAGPGFPLRFVQLTDLLFDGSTGGNSVDSISPGLRYNASLDFSVLASFRAVVFWPEDVTLVMFYELYTACVPLFVPVTFWRHMHGQSTLSLAEGDASWRTPAPPGVPSPFTARHFDAEGGPFVLDVEAAMYWAQFSDFAIFPHVERFEGIPDLMRRLLAADLQGISARMRAFNDEQLLGAVRFWRTQVGRWTEAAAGAGSGQ